MKPILSLFVLFCSFFLVSTDSQAQTFEGEQDISVSYGLISGRQLVDQQTVNNEGDGNMESSNSGNIFVSYKYFLEDRFAAGITAGFQTINGGVYYYSGIREDNYRLINKTIAGEMTLVYLNKPVFQLYTLLGAGSSFASLISNIPVNNSYSSGPGYTMVFQPVTGTRFNFQYDPLCLRAGKKIQGYLELGVGYKGIVNAGLIYRMGRKKVQPAH